MKKADLIILSSNQKKRIERLEDLLNKAADEINGLQVSLMSSRMFLTAVMKKTENEEITFTREELNDIVGESLTDFEEIVDGEGFISGVRVKCENPTKEIQQ